MKFFDGINHPSAATVIADGLDGGMLYLGTPASGKDVTAAQYRDYKAHHLKTIVGFEHVITDWLGGAAAGRRNAAAFLADARAKGVDPDDPFWVAIDMHVTAGDLPTVVAYVRAFVATVRAGGWRGPAGGYGFPEVTTALHAARVVDWYWGAGRRADQPPFVNVWQDNTQTILVGGSRDDEDWVLIPIPTEEDDVTNFNSPDTDPGPGHYGHDLLNVDQLANNADYGFKALAAKLDAVPAAVHGLDVHTSAQFAAVADQIAALAAAVKSITGAISDLTADMATIQQKVDAQQPDTLTGQATVTVELNPGIPA